MKFRILAAILSSVFTFVTQASAGEKSEFNWNSWQARMDFGLATKLAKEAGEKTHFVQGPMLEYGIEKGFVLSQNYYFGADVTWNVFYPDNFRATSIDPRGLWLIPITHLHAGYVFGDQSLLTLGSTYFWGLIATYRKPISEKSYVEIKGVKWLDEPWDGDIPFHKAVHEYFVTAGVGYTLPF